MKKTAMNPTIICLTPVRNEAWVLDRFLKAASLWADYIIIADQMSTDGSREIAMKYPKVILVDNNTEEFNEPERQKLLINEARKIEGPRLLITLDADEMFTPNILTSDEWQAVLTFEPGTIFKFQWANLHPDLKHFWYGYYFPWGYMDDGFEHNGTNKIHSGRIPIPENHPVITIESIKVIHFQYTDWNRMLSKHCWYQCLEVVNYPDKSAFDIYRQYHHMDVINKNEFIDIPINWCRDYKKYNVDIFRKNNGGLYWFDKQVLNLFEGYGSVFFKKLVIWDIDWKLIAHKWDLNHIITKDKRNFLDRLIQKWLKFSQAKLHIKTMRRIDRIIRKITKY
ncbi:MAG: glycosyltransferase family 2 protein [Paludibacter sp.]